VAGWLRFSWVFALCLSLSTWAAESVPILVYHRFGPTVADSMTVRTAVFEAHLRYLKEQGYRVVALLDVVNALRNGSPDLPDKAVVISVDDGHRSVYTQMLPLVQRYQIPVTLFIYPSAISNASYAMTWEQLRALQLSGWFNIQSHTYWHPNFKQEKRRLTPEAYHDFVRMQLLRSKQKLQQTLGIQIDLLAWPFGIYDDELQQQAHAVGYVAAFSIDGRSASRTEPLLALPRLLMVDRIDERALVKLLQQSSKPVR
jgi:peptidoglycan/xylan/chitin deacetylase (PgdA/CDA1 family)